MAHETLVCAEGISPDRLSALRDEALSADETRRLRAHIAGCAACRARMADFDAVAGALRSQRELDPGDRILAGVHARMASRGVGRGWRAAWDAGGGRRVWAGLAALAPVAALILLFVYVFSGVGRHPNTAATPTAGVPTVTNGKSVVPTATPATVHVPVYTQSVAASSAWPTFLATSPTTGQMFAPSGSQVFIPDAFSADLSEIGGVLYSYNAQGAASQPVQLAYYSAASNTIIPLGPTWRGYIGPWGGVLSIDSNYIVYSFNSQPGGTCGVCHNTLWSLDRATGKTWNFNANISGDMTTYVSADHVVFMSVDGQAWVADLAAHSVKVALPIGSQPYNASTQPIADERLLGFQWPYLLYAETPASTVDAQAVTTRNILDLATGVNTPITASMYDQSGHPIDIQSSGPANMALIGTTLYADMETSLSGVDASGQPVNITYGSLYRLNNAITPGGKFTLVATWPITGTAGGTELAATRHLIWLGHGYFWDNAELRLVQTTFTNVQLIGPSIVAVDAQPPGAPVQTYRISVYDTSRFPTPPGW